MATESKITIKPVEIGLLKLKVIGKSPYLPEPMDMAVLEMYNKKKSKQMYKKDDISEEDKAQVKYYYTPDGKKGILVRSFYKAMIKASSYIIDRKEGGMRVVKEGVTINGDVIPIKFAREEQITHWGRTSGMSKAPRKIIRNAFYDWSCELEIEYNKNQLSAEQIVNILNWAGFHIGAGGFRKENTGNYGSFMVKV